MNKLEFATTINEVIPDFVDRFKYDPPLLDSNYQHIAKRIALMWGSQEVVDYIENDLIHHSPDANRPIRAGFSKLVMDEIFNILLVHTEKFPQYKAALTLRALNPYG